MTIPQNVISAITKNNIANDRTAFQRRLTNLESYVIEAVNPLEEQILLIREKLIPLYDKVGSLRDEARDFCTHPPEQLRIVEQTESAYTIKCAFCDEVFHVPADV